jgi:hypothetical protein
MLKYGLGFSVGVVVTLIGVKIYAQWKTDNAIHDALGSLGLGGGKIENFAKAFITPAVA